LVNIKVKDPEAEDAAAKPGALKKRDELYESAVDLVVREGRGSVSLLQRALGIGYGRAARLIDFMAEDGIVGQYNGSQARDILITLADWERMQGLSSVDESSDTSAAPSRGAANTLPPPRRNIVRPEPWSDHADDDDAEDQIADEKSDEEDVDGNDLDEDDRYQAESA
jgi:S-DNA-T family DNA segregation ATPase FtsK/SpoIIIE